VEQVPSLQSYSRSTGQEIPCLLRNTKLNYCVQNSPVLVPTWADESSPHHHMLLPQRLMTFQVPNLMSLSSCLMVPTKLALDVAWTEHEALSQSKYSILWTFSSVVTYYRSTGTQTLSSVNHTVN